MIQNPILPGFCPDPSIIRVGEDYYIANSSFEWWPGVKIYHSKDLKHYEQLPSPLNRMSQLNMVVVCRGQFPFPLSIHQEREVLAMVIMVTAHDVEHHSSV